MPIRHNRKGVIIEIKVRFAPPTMCHLTAIASNPGATPLFHSDRGYQYTSKAFRQRILDAGMTQSMSRVARCIDNGPMEGFWGLMKREMYYGKKYRTKVKS